MSKPKVCILMPPETIKLIFSKENWIRLNQSFSIYNIIKKITEKAVRDFISDAHGCVTGWGTCCMTKEILDQAPNIKIIAHSAGSVRSIVSDEVWKRGIVVTTAADSIAISVAEYTLGLMLTTMKRVWSFQQLIKKGLWKDEKEVRKIIEPYKAKIGVVSAGYAGRHFIRLLQNLNVKILLFDPYVSEVQAEGMGAVKVSLEDLMSSSDVVSIHAPALPSTLKMISKDMLKRLKDGALFINTARGTVVDEEALIMELKSGRITACLDVTDPEPPLKDSMLRRLSNVILTPHIAGGVANNCYRQGAYVIDELERVLIRGERAKFEVTREAFVRMA